MAEFYKNFPNGDLAALEINYIPGIGDINLVITTIERGEYRSIGLRVNSNFGGGKHLSTHKTLGILANLIDKPGTKLQLKSFLASVEMRNDEGILKIDYDENTKSVKLSIQQLPFGVERPKIDKYIPSSASITLVLDEISPNLSGMQLIVKKELFDAFALLQHSISEDTEKIQAETYV